MTTSRDPDALLSVYLADGTTVLSDRVIDAVLDEAHRTRQRTVFGPRRTPIMFRTAFAAASLLTALIVGGTLLMGALRLTSVEPMPARWIATGSMLAEHIDHEQVRLRDGRVLVAGGFGPSVELYDPRSGSWTAAPAMLVSRSGAFAATLADGRVLMAGGTADDAEYVDGMPVALASAEVFDPRAGTWAAVSDMLEPRSNGAAVVLPDGRVLVSGGRNADTRTASAEVFDPTTGEWTAAASLSRPRSAHTATLLPDGRVLVVGGAFDPEGTGLPSAEVYDPETDAWTPTGSLTEARAYHTASLLQDGRVMVAGGVGRTDGPVPLHATAELFDPATNTWTPTGSMRDGRDAHTATLLLDGTVLVTGGSPQVVEGDVQATAELYDPAAGVWTSAPPMDLPRHYHAATLLLDGTVLVTGGAEGAGRSAVLFYPAGLPTSPSTPTRGPVATTEATATFAIASVPATRTLLEPGSWRVALADRQIIVDVPADVGPVYGELWSDARTARFDSDLGNLTIQSGLWRTNRDWCHPTGDIIELPDTPGEIAAWLHGMAEADVTDRPDVTVDGRTAKVFDFVLHDGCYNSSEPPPGSIAPWQGQNEHVVIYAIPTDGQAVLLMSYAAAESVKPSRAFRDYLDAFVRGLEFPS